LYPKAVDKFPNPSPVVRNLGTCLLFHGLGLDPFPFERLFFINLFLVALNIGKEEKITGLRMVFPLFGWTSLSYCPASEERTEKTIPLVQELDKGVSYEDMKVEFL